MEFSSIALESAFIEEHIHDLQFAAIFGGMTVLFFIEDFIPRRSYKTSQTSRWLNNIGLALLNHLLVIIYSSLVFGLVSIFKSDSPLLEHLKVSDFTGFIVIFITMEFIMYWIHRLFHRIPILWRIHAVHHTDTELDVTTSHRHHPFEPMINALVMTPIVFALGAPVMVIAVYNLLHTIMSLLSHSNISVSQRLDSLMRLFVITPDFHRMHHSCDKKYTDSNFSAIVPWFDYLFKTATRASYHDIPTMELGLETLRAPYDNRLDRLLATPLVYKKSKK